MVGGEKQMQRCFARVVCWVLATSPGRSVLMLFKSGGKGYLGGDMPEAMAGATSQSLHRAATPGKRDTSIRESCTDKKCSLGGKMSSKTQKIN